MCRKFVPKSSTTSRLLSPLLKSTLKKSPSSSQLKMTSVDIRVKDNQHRFQVGERVTGTAEVNIPADMPNSAVVLSFHCVGEVKWTEIPGTPYYQNGYVFFDRFTYYEEELKVNNNDVKVSPFLDHKKLSIPFNVLIPADKNLPSSMSSAHGFIQYFIRVTIKDKTEEKKFVKELHVIAPIEKDLMITVGGSAEKSVLLHNGTVSMHASIARKGFAPGETITVHVNVDNKTNTAVTPRVMLNQVQIFMCGVRHKTVETTVTGTEYGCPQHRETPVSGTVIAPHTAVEELIDVKIPWDESLSIKSSVVTVKYFVHVTLDIPHSFDLHVNLPVVVTSGAVLDSLEKAKKRQSPALIQPK